MYVMVWHDMVWYCMYVCVHTHCCCTYGIYIYIEMEWWEVYIYIYIHTWWLIPLSKWVITPVISGLTLLIPFITGVITHLLSGMSHQVCSTFWDITRNHPSMGGIWQKTTAPGHGELADALPVHPSPELLGDLWWNHGFFQRWQWIGRDTLW